MNLLILNNKGMQDNKIRRTQLCVQVILYKEMRVFLKEFSDPLLILLFYNFNRIIIVK